jgi:hypothetical protein
VGRGEYEVVSMSSPTALEAFLAARKRVKYHIFRRHLRAELVADDATAAVTEPTADVAEMPRACSRA